MPSRPKMDDKDVKAKKPSKITSMTDLAVNLKYGKAQLVFADIDSVKQFIKCPVC